MEKRNSYTCERCAKVIITADIDKGTTPFMIGCKATEGCTGMMRSGFYRGELNGPVAFIWRKPTEAEYKKASPSMQHHFDMGGLDIYPAPTGEKP